MAGGEISNLAGVTMPHEHFIHTREHGKIFEFKKPEY
jgi:hypothetical protein